MEKITTSKKDDSEVTTSVSAIFGIEYLISFANRAYGLFARSLRLFTMKYDLLASYD